MSIASIFVAGVRAVARLVSNNGLEIAARELPAAGQVVIGTRVVRVTTSVTTTDGNRALTITLREVTDEI